MADIKIGKNFNNKYSKAGPIVRADVEIQIQDKIQCVQRGIPVDALSAASNYFAREVTAAKAKNPWNHVV
jgi:hypothetical protein